MRGYGTDKPDKFNFLHENAYPTHRQNRQIKLFTLGITSLS